MNLLQSIRQLVVSEQDVDVLYFARICSSAQNSQ